MKKKVLYDDAAIKADMAAMNTWDLARELGIGRSKRGSTKYIECLSGTHSETQYDHCQCFADGCYCYSCGTRLDNLGIVAAYYARSGKELKYYELLQVCGDLLGGAEKYVLKGNKRIQPPPFTEDELSLIGLGKKARKKRVLAQKDLPEDEWSEWSKAYEQMVSELGGGQTMRQLYRTDRDAYFFLVRGKAKDQLEHLLVEMNATREGIVAGRDDDAAWAYLTDLSKIFAKVRAIFKRAGGRIKAA